MLMDFDRNSMTVPVQSSDYTKKFLQKDSNPTTMEVVTQTNAVKSPTDSPATTKLVYTVKEIARMLAISLRSAYNPCNSTTEFRMDWLPKQCSKHKWALKTYESNLSTIQNLIIPYIGSMEMQKLKPYHMENLYTILSKTPCGSYIEGRKQELTEKQKQLFLSGTTIHEVHRLLGTAFQYAVEWGILVKSPVPVDSPKKSTQERTIWTVEEMRAALDSMEGPILHLAVHLTLVGALREGEIVGLTPEDLDFDAADGIGTFRCHLSADDLRRRCESCSGNYWTCYGGYAGEHLRSYPAVLSCRTGQEV